MSPFRLLSLLFLLVAAPALAAAQEASVPPRLQPPRPVEAVLAPWPSGEEGPPVQVGLVLSIDAAGLVIEAEVVESAGAPFDEAARAAALGFRFEPARRDGEPMAARIRYRHPFEPPEPETVEAPMPLPLAVPPEDPAEELVVTVQGRSEADRRRESAEAVVVIDTSQAQRQAADLGAVLARQEGVEVRRAGGLGSGTRFSLNGLSDDQVRFFLDGVPLDLAGFPYGISNIPVQLVEGIEIYRGVVPIRYGADALGGAINLVTDQRPRGTGASASLLGGAFGTWRLTASGHHHHEPSGFFTRAHLFADRSDNDYSIDVNAAARETGKPQARSVDRFHDGYAAVGGGLDIGFVDLGWADRLVLRLHGAGFDKELQHALVMTPDSVPYGEASWSARSQGSQLIYERALSGSVHLDAVVGWAHQRTRLLDAADWVYDWYGKTEIRRETGEIFEKKRDEITRQDAAFGRINLAWNLAPAHALRFSVAPTFIHRTAEDRLLQVENGVEALETERTQLALTSGIEYELDLFDDRLETIVFVKDYRYAAAGKQPLGRGGVEQVERDLTRTGYGAATRLRLASSLQLKASYEFATRLPRPDEIFGDGGLIALNLELVPETSQNMNLGLEARDLRTGIGSFRGGLHGFARIVENFVVLQQIGLQQSAYQNVGEATAVGTEFAAGWSSPDGLLHLDGNLTWQDFRNTSKAGAFAPYDGDRMIYTPWLFANAAARVELRDVMQDRDELSPFWSSRYVHDFFLAWESNGDPSTKNRIPAQFVQTAGVHYRVPLDPVVAGLTVELDNLGDARTFDFFGVQRPGRAAWLKGIIEY